MISNVQPCPTCNSLQLPVRFPAPDPRPGPGQGQPILVCALCAALYLLARRRAAEARADGEPDICDCPGCVARRAAPAAAPQPVSLRARMARAHLN